MPSLYCSPHVKAYEQQKGFSTIRPQLDGARAAGLPPSFRLRDNELERELQQLFSRRIGAALSGIFDADLAVFPGYLIAAPGADNDRLHNRGILFYEQFKSLLSANCIDADNNVLRGKISFKPVEDNIRWGWKLVEKPALKYMDFEHQPGEFKADATLETICCKAKQLAADNDIRALLTYVRSCWAYSSETPDYSEGALWQGRRWLAELACELEHQFDRDTYLAVLFEIEAYASYASALNKLDVTAGGHFAGNWIEVAAIKLPDFHPSELCQNERLLQELINLPVRGFAPIVVNEKLCVADGNHRLTASWLWNLLCSTATLDWDLNSSNFQRGVAWFIETNAIKPVTVFEILKHLQIFLASTDARAVLATQIRPRVAPQHILKVLPATLLPEYLSGAVVKESYDNGSAIRRAEPILYDILCATPLAVLPPRASYHFTDRALLPWFSIIRS